MHTSFQRDQVGVVLNRRLCRIQGETAIDHRLNPIGFPARPIPLLNPSPSRAAFVYV